MRVSHKLHALGFHLLQAPINNALLHLELRNAVAQQATDAVGLFVNRDPMPGAIQLLRRRQSRRAGADDSDFLPRAHFWRLRANESFREASIHNALFNLLDGHGRRVDAEHASRFARRGTNASSKFGKIVCRMKLAHRFLPAPVIDEIIPVGNQIVDRAAGMAERDAAIHAARPLRAQFVLGEVLINLEPVVHPF